MLAGTGVYCPAQRGSSSINTMFGDSEAMPLAGPAVVLLLVYYWFSVAYSAGDITTPILVVALWFLLQKAFRVFLCLVRCSLGVSCSLAA